MQTQMLREVFSPLIAVKPSKNKGKTFYQTFEYARILNLQY